MVETMRECAKRRRFRRWCLVSDLSMGAGATAANGPSLCSQRAYGRGPRQRRAHSGSWHGLTVTFDIAGSSNAAVKTDELRMDDRRGGRARADGRLAGAVAENMNAINGELPDTGMRRRMAEYWDKG